MSIFCLLHAAGNCIQISVANETKCIFIGIQETYHRRTHMQDPMLRFDFNGHYNLVIDYGDHIWKNQRNGK